MKYRLLMLIISIAVLFGAGTVVFAAKNETAPGQQKKTDQELRVNQNQNNQSTKNADQTTEVDVPTRVVRGNSGNNQKNQPSTVDNITVGKAKPQSEKTDKQEKLGIQEIKKLLSKTSTASGSRSSAVIRQQVALRQASASALMKRQAISGFIIGLEEQTITIRHNTQSDRTWNIGYDASTVIRSSSADSSASAMLAIGQRISAIGSFDNSQRFLASRIHIIPGKFTGIQKRLPVATTSGSLAPTISLTASQSGTTPTVQPSPTVIVSSLTPTLPAE